MIGTDISSVAQSLLCAQSDNDRFAEAQAIRDLVGAMSEPRRSNQNDGKTISQRFYSMVAFGVSDCWYWCGYVDDRGYGRFAFPGENKAHRASWRLHSGDIPEGMKVLHRCDVRSCVNPDHLFLGTQAENVQDMISKGRQNFPDPAYGEENPMSKLTWNDVQEIRELYKSASLSMAKIARRYGVSPMTIHRAIRGKTWNRH